MRLREDRISKVKEQMEKKDTTTTTWSRNTTRLQEAPKDSKNTTMQLRRARDKNTRAKDTTKEQKGAEKQEITTKEQMKEKGSREWKLCNQHALMGCLAP